MEKRKLKITLQVLNKVKVEFPGTKEFIERQDQKCLKENMSVEEIIYIFQAYKQRVGAEKMCMCFFFVCFL